MKKIFLKLSAGILLVAPITAVIACGSGSDAPKNDEVEVNEEPKSKKIALGDVLQKGIIGLEQSEFNYVINNFDAIFINQIKTFDTDGTIVSSVKGVIDQIKSFGIEKLFNIIKTIKETSILDWSDKQMEDFQSIFTLFGATTNGQATNADIEKAGEAPGFGSLLNSILKMLRSGVKNAAPTAKALIAQFFGQDQQEGNENTSIFKRQELESFLQKLLYDGFPLSTAANAISKGTATSDNYRDLSKNLINALTSAFNSPALKALMGVDLNGDAIIAALKDYMLSQTTTPISKADINRYKEMYEKQWLNGGTPIDAFSAINTESGLIAKFRKITEYMSSSSYKNLSDADKEAFELQKNYLSNEMNFYNNTLKGVLNSIETSTTTAAEALPLTANGLFNFDNEADMEKSLVFLRNMIIKIKLNAGQIVDQSIFSSLSKAQKAALIRVMDFDFMNKIISLHISEMPSPLDKLINSGARNIDAKDLSVIFSVVDVFLSSDNLKLAEFGDQKLEAFLTFLKKGLQEAKMTNYEGLKSVIKSFLKLVPPLSSDAAGSLVTMLIIGSQ